MTDLRERPGYWFTFCFVAALIAVAFLTSVGL